MHVFDQDGIVIQIASAESLLATKLRAGRQGRDERDIARLMVICGLSSLLELEEVHEEYYPGESLSPRAERLVEQVIRIGLPDRPVQPPPPVIG